MGKIKVLSIFGTRPEAVKMAPVLRCLAEDVGMESGVCVTAQHRQMLDQVLALFQIKPDIDLDLMLPDQSLSQLTANIFTHLDPILESWKPDWILVQGDTTTVMVASLAAFYRHIFVGHVEAGLRTKDKWQPFPEEINRRIASVLADLHFAPTEHSRDNLLREGIPEWQVVVTGNPVIDALQEIVKRNPPVEVIELLKKLGIGQRGRRLVLLTAHRRENFGEPIESICRAVKKLASVFHGEIQFVYPVHLNPHIQEPVYRLLGQTPNVTLLPPLDYLPLVHLMCQATLILTDSGGIQEEATALNIPTLVLRQTTERPEGIEAGALRLVGTDSEVIQIETCKLLEDQNEYLKMKNTLNPFGDGHAAERIVKALRDYREHDSVTVATS